MNDPEMVTLAAKAIGIQISSTGELYEDFDSLKDYGDALRLIARLHLKVECTEHGQVYIWRKGCLIWNDFALNKESTLELERATCRAITRASAEVGKAMP